PRPRGREGHRRHAAQEPPGPPDQAQAAGLCRPRASAQGPAAGSIRDQTGEPVTQSVEQTAGTTETADAAEATEAIEATEAAEATEATTEATATRAREPVVIDRRIQTVGRRKEAVVRVWLVPGTGQFNLDGRTLEDYFPNKVHQQLIKAPL